MKIIQTAEKKLWEQTFPIYSYTTIPRQLLAEPHNICPQKTGYLIPRLHPWAQILDFLLKFFVILSSGTKSHQFLKRFMHLDPPVSNVGAIMNFGEKYVQLCCSSSIAELFCHTLSEKWSNEKRQKTQNFIPFNSKFPQQHSVEDIQVYQMAFQEILTTIGQPCQKSSSPLLLWLTSDTYHFIGRSKPLLAD